MNPHILGVPYGMITVLYDTNYDYEFGETQAREDVMITQTPQFLSEPLELVIVVQYNCTLW